MNAIKVSDQDHEPKNLTPIQIEDATVRRPKPLLRQPSPIQNGIT
jgi:hypothetical protein